MAQIPYMNWMGDQPSGSAYDVYQYYLGGGSPGGTSTPTSGGGGIASLPWYQQTGGGGGGDFKGGGRYGNLDLSKTKTFNKNVWGGEIGGPANMYGGWKPQDVTGFYNPTTGQYQTLAGKNIQHAGINIQPMFASLLGLDKKGPKPGDIEGTFTKGWESGKGKIKEGLEDEKEKLAKIFSSKKSKAKKAQIEKIANERIAKEKIAAAEKAAAAQAPGGGQWVGGAPAYTYQGQGGGEYTDPHTGSRDYHDPYDPGGGEKEGGLIRKAQGGMINDPEYRGWKKMYETNPEIGSMHEKHPTFIKFYKKHERDKKQFGGLAGLLYG